MENFDIDPKIDLELDALAVGLHALSIDFDWFDPETRTFLDHACNFVGQIVGRPIGWTHLDSNTTTDSFELVDSDNIVVGHVWNTCTGTTSTPDGRNFEIEILDTPRPSEY